MQIEDELLDVQDVAARLRVNPRTVLRMADRGDLKAIKVARRWRFRHSDLDKYLQGKELEIRMEVPEVEAANGREPLPMEAPRAEPRKQMTTLDEEIQLIEIAQRRLELEKEQLELEARRVDYIVEKANKLATMLCPGDEEKRAELLRSMLSRVLGPGNSKTLGLVLTAPKNSEEAWAI